MPFPWEISPPFDHERVGSLLRGMASTFLFLVRLDTQTQFGKGGSVQNSITQETPEFQEPGKDNIIFYLDRAVTF